MAISSRHDGPPIWNWQPNVGYTAVNSSMSGESYQNTPDCTGSISMLPEEQYPQQSSFGSYSYYALSPGPPYRQQQQQHMERAMPSLPSLCSTQSSNFQDPSSVDSSSSPFIKNEPTSIMATQTNSTYDISSAGRIKRSPASSPRTIIPIIPIGGATEIQFHTPIDNLMREIQAKRMTDSGATEENDSDAKTEMQDKDVKAPASQTTCSQTTSPAAVRHNRRIYKCTISGCQRVCKQKTHLQIHIRSHTGEKPYVCSFPDCGKRFSQAGNLKTHYRRHTKERPFKCERCDKRFPQRGNLRSHMENHLRTVTFICKLDSCNKSFTARGNLKTHQNHFHLQTILNFHTKLQGVEMSKISREDIKMLQYLEDIHKNSNKGIKGRGKHAKVLPINNVSALSTPPSRAPINHISTQCQPHQSPGPVTPPMSHTTYMGHNSIMATPGLQGHDPYATYGEPVTSVPSTPRQPIHNEMAFRTAGTNYAESVRWMSNPSRNITTVPN